jgi:phage terminase large subunit GpA-like protein
MTDPVFLDDYDFILKLNAEAPTKPPMPLVSEYIHERRILPPGTPKPGPLDIHYAPYSIEIMDAMGPYSGVNIVSILKAAQTTLTSAAENCIAYYIDEKPEEILYCSGTDDLLTKWTKRLESLISSCGFRDKIVAQNDDNKKSRKAGDKAKSKEYAGGSLSLASLQAPASLRMESKKIIFIDEIDAAPPNLSTGEGSGLKVVHARAMGFGSRGKFMEYSTPTTYERSTIFKRYELGDQRKYFVPCVKCGHMQELDWQRLQPEYDDKGYLIEAYYECEKEGCKYLHRNHEKTWMMALENGAEWRPTNMHPQSKKHRSYYISAMYSPVGMVSWTDFYQEYLDSLEDPDARQPFMNNFVGLPYKEEGHRPDHKKISKYTGEYKMKSVPDEVIFLTMAADVQRGKEKYQAMSPDELDRVTEKLIESKGADNVWKTERLPRIEFEIMGVGLNLKTWLIDYGVVYGHTTLGPHEGAFRKLREMIESGKFSYLKKDGQKMAPVMVFIDASDGMTRQSVFDFCHGWPKVFPIVNHAEMKLKKDKMIDEASPFDIDRYRFKNKAKDGGAHYLLSVNHYKARLYRNLNTPRNQSGNQAPTFCDFPRDTPEHYFKMLTAEEMREDGSFHRSESVPAEALDCRAYNLAVEDIFLDLKVEEAKKAARLMRYKKGPRKGERMYSDSEVDDIDSKWVLNQMKQG